MTNTKTPTLWTVTSGTIEDLDRQAEILSIGGNPGSRPSCAGMVLSLREFATRRGMTIAAPVRAPKRGRAAKALRS